MHDQYKKKRRTCLALQSNLHYILGLFLIRKVVIAKIRSKINSLLSEQIVYEEEYD